MRQISHKEEKRKTFLYEFLLLKTLLKFIVKSCLNTGIVYSDFYLIWTNLHRYCILF